jgi:hypothetical protein
MESGIFFAAGLDSPNQLDLPQENRPNAHAVLRKILVRNASSWVPCRDPSDAVQGKPHDPALIGSPFTES